MDFPLNQLFVLFSQNIGPPEGYVITCLLPSRRQLIMTVTTTSGVLFGAGLFHGHQLAKSSWLSKMAGTIFLET